MATLELAIDATKAQQGAQVAEQAMTRVTKAAEGTGKAVQDAGAKMSAAFQATGGSIQIAGGLAQTAKAFGELNVQAGLFNSSRLLLEIGKTAQDFRELSAGVTGVSGAFGVLTTIIKANPLLAAATAIGAIASAISLFSSETKKATNAYEELGATISKARLDAQTAAYLGVPGPGNQGQMQALFNAVGQARQSGMGINLQQLGQLGGGRTAANYLMQSGTPEQQRAALEYLQTGGYLQTRMETVPGLQMQRPVTQRVQGLPSIQLDAAQTQEVLRLLYRQVADSAAQVAREQASVYQFGAAETPQQFPTIGLPGGALATAGYQYDGGRLRPQYQVEPGQAPPLVARPDRVTMTGTGGTAFMASQALENAVVTAAAIAQYKKQEEEAARRIAENFQRAADYAGQVGGSLGSAFADVLMKTTTLRQAFASIVASFARQGLADIGAAIFRGAVQGLTPTQSTANATPPPTA